MVDRRSGGGPEDWSEDDWPGSDWERTERPSRPAAPREPDRPRARAPHTVSEEIDADLSRVMDDPMFDALPGGVPLRERGRPGVRGPDRLSARRDRSGPSFGQTLLLLLAIALVAGVSFAAGLIMGASGDRTLLSWIPGFGSAGTETVTADRALDAGMAPDEPAEGVITFGERGRVPPKTEEGAEPLPEERARAAAKPETGDTEAPREGIAQEAPPAQAQPARESTQAPAPAAEERAEVRPSAREPGSSEDMTFYDTATGKREVPGLDAEGTGGREAGAGTGEGVPQEAQPDTAAVDGAAGAPLGADVLARRRAEQAEPPPPPVATAQAPRAIPDEAPAEGPPSGAEILARRRAESSDAVAGAPAPATGTGTSGAPIAGAEPAATGRGPSGAYTIQVATLTSSEEARGLAERLAAKGFRPRIDILSSTSGTALYRVRVGSYGDERAAQRDLERIREERGTSPFIKME